MTFHSIVKQWCERYKYMKHTRENKRFYLTDSQMGVVDMAKDISNAFSPCVVMESGPDGSGPLERPVMNYPIYFFVRAEKMADGGEAAVAYETALYHMKRFLGWLKYRHNKEIEEDNIDGDFARIELDGAYIDIEPVGPLQNGWFAVMIQLMRVEPLNLCIDENEYLTDEELEAQRAQFDDDEECDDSE